MKSLFSKMLLAFMVVGLIFVANSSFANNSNPAASGFMPPGLPFMTIWDELASLRGTMDTLEAQIDENMRVIDLLDAECIEMAALIAQNEGNIDKLQTAIEENEEKIALLNAELTALEGQLALKQNILNSSCPSGYSIRYIYPNGSIICESDTVYLGYLNMYHRYGYFYIPYGQTWDLYTYCSYGDVALGGGGHYVPYPLSATSLGVTSEYYLNGWITRVYNWAYYPDAYVRTFVTCIDVQNTQYQGVP
jgi:uncharacterized small protein (DUF1192 family)